MASTIVRKVSVGTPQFLSQKETMAFEFHNFASLPKDKPVVTSDIACHGEEWYLRIYPWGRTDEAKKQQSVSLGLSLHTGEETDIRTLYDVRIGGVAESGERTYKHRTTWGWDDFENRSKVLESLDENGTLTIFVDLQVWLDKPTVYQPDNSWQKQIIKLYNADTGTDVAFQLGEDFVRAHKAVLAIQCPALLEFASESTAMNVEIQGADPDIFATMIRYMYYKELPADFDLKRNGICLLKLANRFDCTDLKLHLEAKIVESDNIVKVDTAAELLLLADGQSCALLKEVALQSIVTNSKEVMKTEGWKKLAESHALVLEVFSELSKSISGDDDQETVSSLRKRLADIGLDVDGTKEMLVKRLKTGESVGSK